MRYGRTQDELNRMAHRHYSKRYVGDGAKVEFLIPTTVERLEDVTVFVDGLRKAADEPGSAHDYAVRGLTFGYNGDRNTIKLAAAPAAGKVILIDAVGG